jgi:hypothetical protein
MHQNVNYVMGGFGNEPFAQKKHNKFRLSLKS